MCSHKCIQNLPDFTNEDIEDNFKNSKCFPNL